MTEIWTQAALRLGLALLTVLVWSLAFLPGIVPVHHGVASPGAVGLEGPGVPRDHGVEPAQAI